jgi:hypothetical protein
MFCGLVTSLGVGGFQGFAMMILGLRAGGMVAACGGVGSDYEKPANLFEGSEISPVD